MQQVQPTAPGELIEGFLRAPYEGEPMRFVREESLSRRKIAGSEPLERPVKRLDVDCTRGIGENNSNASLAMGDGKMER